MKNTLLRKLFLLVFYCFFGIVYDVHATHDVRVSFKTLWKDPSKKDVAVNCIQECISDERIVLNVTKHLIGHDHVLDISELTGKLPASFLFINSGDQVQLLKFLRGLYKIVNDGTKGHKKGALCVLLENDDFKRTNVALIEMKTIFNYGLHSSFKKNSQSVLEKISQLTTIVELNRRIMLGKNAAETFYKQLNANNVSAGLIILHRGYQKKLNYISKQE